MPPPLPSPLPRAYIYFSNGEGEREKQVCVWEGRKTSVYRLQSEEEELGRKADSGNEPPMGEEGDSTSFPH